MFNALEDVSVQVPRGTSLGIVGHNGAGKTTLLRVIAGITTPTGGAVSASGRIAALLDVLVGFHPELTGRENIYLVSAMHGHGRADVAPRVPEILEFAEIGDLADTPLKRYSAGMGARLGFAIITALDVDILLIDEVLAVGDAAFQRKCVRWLEGFREGGGTLLFVSHNLALVRSMTERAVWLDHGKVAADSPTKEVLDGYARAMERRDAGSVTYRRKVANKLLRVHGLDRWGSGGARAEQVNFQGPDSGGTELGITIAYEASELRRAVFCVAFLDEGGREVGGAASPPLALDGQGRVRCRLRPLPLRSGIYFPVVAILSPDGQVRDRWRLDRAIVIDRDGDGSSGVDLGPVEMPAAWSAR
jgi:lipopolysaccharide transport system ATP-binding protein